MTPQEAESIRFKVIGVIAEELQPAVRKALFPPPKVMGVRAEPMRISLDEFRRQVTGCNFTNWHREAARVSFAFDNMPTGTVLELGNRRYAKTKAKGLCWEFQCGKSHGWSGGNFGLEVCFPGMKAEPEWREYLVRQAYRMLYPG